VAATLEAGVAVTGEYLRAQRLPAAGVPDAPLLLRRPPGCLASLAGRAGAAWAGDNAPAGGWTEVAESHDGRLSELSADIAPAWKPFLSGRS